MSRNTVVHIPHASMLIPDEYRDQFVLDDEALEREKLKMTDLYTDELFSGIDGFFDLVFPVSRLLVDPERFADDVREPMAEIGMGAIYKVTSDLLPLRRFIGEEERQHLMDTFYKPHHAELTDLVRPPAMRGARVRRGGPGSSALIIDAHSFPGAPLPYESNQDGLRPEICIGADPDHTSDDLLGMAVSLFRKAGFTVAVNAPFSGALVPADFYQRDRSVFSIMIEVRRDLYMNEATGEKNRGFDAFSSLLRSLLSDLDYLYWSRKRRLDATRVNCNELYRYSNDKQLRQLRKLSLGSA